MGRSSGIFHLISYFRKITMWYLNVFIENQTKVFLNKCCFSRITYTTTNTHKTTEKKKQERPILDALRLKIFYPFLALSLIIMHLLHRE